MFERGRSTLDVDIKTLMMLDSLQMTEADREIIIYSCKKSEFGRIVLTHGTDTMVQTAAALAKHRIPKTIIITGAMIPYAFGTSSDGFFNLGAALAFVQTLPHGVYIAMNGRYYHWDEVKKTLKQVISKHCNYHIICKLSHFGHPHFSITRDLCFL
ncbi:MAG: asparaginase [Saprospiraceae bacterium]|nr:asparaginase [Saprospiraceae bacterium]